MTRFQIVPLALTCAVTLTGCYDLQSSDPIFSSSTPWTAVNSVYATNAGSGGQVFAFRGETLLRIAGSTVEPRGTNHFANLFGETPYTVDSFAQTHEMGWLGDILLHAQAVGGTDEPRLIRAPDTGLYNSEWVEPYYASFNAFNDGTHYFDIVHICDLAAIPVPHDGQGLKASDLHVYASFLAADQENPGSRIGGVMELGFTEHNGDWGWYPKLDKYGTWQRLWVYEEYAPQQTPPSYTFYSPECMPISVTRGGDQPNDYLVVADPSADTISVFDPLEVDAGPLDTLYRPDAGANILDITVEGYEESGKSHAFVVTLWGDSTGERLEHSRIVDGDIYEPFLTEDAIEDDIQLITSRGLGAETSSEELYTFGGSTLRRTYSE